MRRFALVVITLAAACGDDGGVHHLADAPVCTQDRPTIAIVAPSTYACHEPFKSKVSLTNNGSCDLTVQDIKLTAEVTFGPCGPAGPGTYPPMTMVVQPGQTAVVLDLTSAPFCCTSPGCPSTLQCDETFRFEVTTNAGAISRVATAHLSLDGCDVVCP